MSKTAYREEIHRIKYNPDELRIIKEMESLINRPMSVERLADVLYKDEKRPENWRPSTLVRLRKLAMKTLLKATKPGDYIISRTTSLGRGNEAAYIMRRKG